MINVGKLTYEQCLWLQVHTINDVEKACQNHNMRYLDEYEEEKLEKKVKEPMLILEKLGKAGFEVNFETSVMQDAWIWWLGRK